MFKRCFAVLVLTLLSLGGDLYAKSSYSSGGRGRSSSSSSGSRSSSSYSSGSKSYSSGSSSPSKSPSYSSGSKSYSSGSTPSSPSPSSPSAPSSSSGSGWWSKKSASPALDSKAGSAAKYAQAQKPSAAAAPSAPRPSYTLSSPQVRQQKTQVYYSAYYSRPVPTYIYHDNYNPYFWMWMMDRSDNDRAMWAYNHRSDMDQQRYQELLAKDASLAQKIKDLEAKGQAVDPNYKPAGVDDDLVYDQPPEESSHFWWWVLAFGVLVGSVYLCFFRRWGAVSS